MSKTTPVRWWRDAAPRYATRGPQLVPAQPVPEWGFELIKAVEPGIAAAIDQLDQLRDEYMRGGFARSWLTPPAVIDPIAAVLGGIDPDLDAIAAERFALGRSPLQRALTGEDLLP